MGLFKPMDVQWDHFSKCNMYHDSQQLMWHLWVVDMLVLDPLNYILFEIKLQVLNVLIFNNHVVKDDTSNHNITHNLLMPLFTWILENGKPTLQHAKTMFSILFDNHLSFKKILALFSLWLMGYLHKTNPSWVYAIYK